MFKATQKEISKKHQAPSLTTLKSWKVFIARALKNLKIKFKMLYSLINQSTIFWKPSRRGTLQYLFSQSMATQLLLNLSIASKKLMKKCSDLMIWKSSIATRIRKSQPLISITPSQLMGLSRSTLKEWKNSSNQKEEKIYSRLKWLDSVTGCTNPHFSTSLPTSPSLRATLSQRSSGAGRKISDIETSWRSDKN